MPVCCTAQYLEWELLHCTIAKAVAGVCAQVPSEGGREAGKNPPDGATSVKERSSAERHEDAHRLEGVHAFYVSIFEGVEHLRT